MQRQTRTRMENYKYNRHSENYRGKSREDNNNTESSDKRQNNDDDSDNESNDYIESDEEELNAIEDTNLSWRKSNEDCNIGLNKTADNKKRIAKINSRMDITLVVQEKEGKTRIIRDY